MPQREFFRDNSEKIDSLVNKFQSFPEISKTKIEMWIENFSDEHKDLALKVLDNVDYFDTAKLHLTCKDLFEQIKSLKNGDLSKVYFSSFGTPAGSGEHLLSIFRSANNLVGSQNASKFKSISEINDLSLEQGITIVFLDDFIGTGNQALDFWGGIASIVPQDANIYLASVCAFEEGIKNIQDNTEMNVLCHRRLNDQNKLFSSLNQKFSRSEKEILLGYCNSTNSNSPLGYGDCQATVVMSYRTPNNTVAILSVQDRKWNGIFPRYHNN